LPSTCHKRPGLLTYLSENDSKLKDWVNFGIHWKIFAFSALALGLWPWPWHLWPF